jgi:tRNA (adenine57-N1/adenine58-N1)-methyltransferase
MMTKILFDEHGKKYYVHDVKKDFHTQHGFITARDLQSGNAVVRSNTGHQFFIVPATFSDRFDKIKRGPQIITRKDIGLIIAETAITKESHVLDAGTGSGALACFLAGIAHHVTSYEREKKYIAIAEHNKRLLGVKNVTIKHKDIYQGIAEKDLDVIILDLPEPHNVLPHLSALKRGGFLVTYLPSLTQVNTFLTHVNTLDTIIHVKTVELLQRQWVIKKNVARPAFTMLGHTAFLTFCRRV